jgi:hypothetical protein
MARSFLSDSPTYWYDDYDDVVVVGSGGGTLMYDLIVGAIKTFAGVAERLFPDEQSRVEQSLQTWLLVGLAVRFLLGLAVLGSLSFLSLAFSLSLFVPLQMANGFGNLRVFGRARRARGGTGESAGGARQIMIIVVVLIGAVNTLLAVYKRLEKTTQTGLMYLETQILEVNPDERREAREKRERGDGWWWEWLREKRFLTVGGWQVVGVRTWHGIRATVGL